ncbi:hypothetical protein [Myxacorys almedinensis]|nr:hypothetical protein [Myxacorys almedinensis]
MHPDDSPLALRLGAFYINPAALESVAPVIPNPSQFPKIANLSQR